MRIVYTLEASVDGYKWHPQAVFNYGEKYRDENPLTSVSMEKEAMMFLVNRRRDFNYVRIITSFENESIRGTNTGR